MTLVNAKKMQLAVCVVLSCMLSSGLFAQDHPVDPGLIAHEWGTFTSVAGNDGQAVEWRPLNLSTDLPGFVEHLHFLAFKEGLRATVRMETPVLYFYSSHPLTLSVHVSFAQGLITEWYPHATSPAPDEPELRDVTRYEKHVANGSVFWNSVNLQPGWTGDLPRDATPRGKFGGNVVMPIESETASHYYAARQTSSTPLQASNPSGEQHEKFLFYRGVSFFSVPISAKFMADGKLLVRSSMQEEIPKLILFERRGESIGYRISDGAESSSGIFLEPVELTARPESLYGDLEEILVARGLYRDEAHAMIETWRNSWFEEGSRLFYIVPQSFVDSILPLTITPAPAHTVRVFVGRLELISQATEKAVTAAMAAHDKATLEKYGRFLEPITAAIKEKKDSTPKLQGDSSIPPPCPVDAGLQIVKQH